MRAADPVSCRKQIFFEDFYRLTEIEDREER